MNDYLARTDNFMAALDLDQVYRVGGSVRDEILGRRVKDADYVVFGENMATVGHELGYAARRLDSKSAVTPLKLRTGAQGGWRVAAKGLGCIEVMLPRMDVSTGPGHSDFDIIIDPDLTLEDDAKRRDFTFNAIYADVKDGLKVKDPLGGINDLFSKRIQVTYENSFRDDPLRILRALRFVSTLGYELAPPTRWLMERDAKAATGLTKLGYASGTLYEELTKLLMGENVATALRLARDAGVLAAAFPELKEMIGFDQGSRYHDMTTDEHTFVALERAAHVNAPLEVRLALLFHDSGKPETAWIGKDGRKHYYAKFFDDPFAPYTTEDHEIAGARRWRKAARRMGVPNNIRDHVDKLILNHMVPCKKVDPIRARRERVRLGDEVLRNLYMMRMCDLAGKGEKNRRMLENVAAMEGRRAAAEADKVPVSVKDLSINGRDLMELGAEGKQIGEVLRAVLDEVVCQPDELRLSRCWQLRAAERLCRA